MIGYKFRSSRELLGWLAFFLFPLAVLSAPVTLYYGVGQLALMAIYLSFLALFFPYVIFVSKKMLLKGEDFLLLFLCFIFLAFSVLAVLSSAERLSDSNVSHLISGVAKFFVFFSVLLVYALLSKVLPTGSVVNLLLAFLVIQVIVAFFQIVMNIGFFYEIFSVRYNPSEFMGINRRASGTLGNPNYLAILSGASLVGSFLCCLKFRNKKFVLLLLVSLSLLALTQSRTMIILSLVVLIAMTPFALFPNGLVAIKPLLRLMFYSALFFIFVAVVVFYYRDLYAVRGIMALTVSGGYLDTSVSGRMDFWQAILEEATHRHFSTSLNRYSEVVPYGDNNFLFLWYRFGLYAGIALYALYFFMTVVVFLRTIRVVASSKGRNGDFACYVSATACALYLLVIFSSMLMESLEHPKMVFTMAVLYFSVKNIDKKFREAMNE